MNEELNQVENEVEEKLKVKNRFQELSEKVRLTAQERDELAKSKQTLESTNSDLSKERDFYKDFSANVSKYPAASEFQDKILEKVKGGYTTEDAMVAVLAREGRLTTPEPVRQSVNVVGGSAPTIQGGAKSLSEMTAAEKFAALGEAEASGSLVDALRGR